VAEEETERKEEAAGAAVETPEQEESARPARGRLLRILLWLLVIAALVAGAWLGWQRYYQADPMGGEPPDSATQQRAQARGTAEVEVEVERLSGLVHQLQAQLQEQRRGQSALGERLAALQRELEAARQRAAAQGMAPDRDLLQALEVEELLRLAAHRLWLSRSPQGVMSLLSRADRLLAELADPGLEPVREALAADITALKLAPQPDIEGIYLRIGALEQGVAQLRAAPQPEVAETEAPETSSGEQGFWRQLAANAWTAVRTFSAEHLRIRSLDQPPPVLLTAAEEVRLQQYLRLLLSQAQLALLERRPEIYRAALERAEELLVAQFAGDSRTPAVATELAELRAREIAPPLPDLRTARQRLRDYLARRDAAAAGAAPQ
jgi:uroporphyrin-3 C-methyltransferase